MGLAGAALAGGSATLAVNGQGTTTAGSVVDGTPVLYGPSDSAVTVVWTVKAAARGWVEYGETSELGSVGRSTPDGFVPHHERVLKLRLRGLKPGTRYWWRTATAPLKGGTSEYSPLYSFRTLEAAAAQASFAVWNDTHDHAETIAKLHALTGAEPPDFVVWNGDVSNNVDKPEVIPGLYVHPKGANLAEGAPRFLARGNHDVRGLWANCLADYVDSPSGRPFHAFRHGPLAAIILDTGEDKPDAHPTFNGLAAFEPLIREQAEWLRQVIARPEIRKAPFRLVFCHIPLRWKTEDPVDYDKGGFDWFSRRGREAWHDSLVRWRAHAVISGHMHQWACLPATKAFPYAQIVGGGPKADNATLIRGRVTKSGMTVRIHALDGRELHTSVFKA